jgi:hypothetical protein
VGAAVCRNCWTWYANGETVCPTCRVPLTGADGGAPTATPASMGVGQAPQAPPGAPATVLGAPPAGASGGLNRLLPLGAIGVVVLIGVAIMLTLHLGGPAKASDGSFQVQAPRGWSPDTASEVDGYPVILALVGPMSGGQLSKFDVADFGQLVPLSVIEANWQSVSTSQLAQSGTFGPLTQTSVGGAPALIVDYTGRDFSGQLLFIDYGNKTYIVALESAPSAFSRLRGTDFAQILSSWEWLH